MIWLERFIYDKKIPQKAFICLMQKNVTWWGLIYQVLTAYKEDLGENSCTIDT